MSYEKTIHRSHRLLRGLLGAGILTSVGLALPQGGTWVQEPSNLPMNIYNHRLAYDTSTQAIYLFGGGGATSLNPDLLQWTAATRTWSVLSSAPTGPSPRRTPAFATDAAGNVWLFGGGNTSLLNDTWYWNGTAWNNPSFSGSGPSPREGMRMVYDHDEEHFVLFGGQISQTGYVWDNQTWVLDPTTGWTMVNGGAGMAPSPRYDYSMVYDDRYKVVLLFGGSNDPSSSSGAFGDTWSFDGSVWTELSASGPARFKHEMVYDPSTGITRIFGGTQTSGGLRFNDEWYWDWDSTSWIQITQGSPVPPERSNAGMALDESTGELILCGGENPQGTVHNDTWSCQLDPTDVTYYCQGLPNSAGTGARIGYSGLTSIAANNFRLEVRDAIPNQFGLFFYGPNQISVPWGQGLRCVGGGISRLSPPQLTNCAGSASRLIDFNLPPVNSGPGAILAGSTWSFQFWIRDPSGGPAGFNASDALTAHFKP